MSDWKGRAEREAAAILAEINPSIVPLRHELIALLAIAWLQGANYADHATLSSIEDAFDELRASL